MTIRKKKEKKSPILNRKHKTFHSQETQYTENYQTQIPF